MVVALLQRRAGKAVAAVVMLALLDKITGALTTLPFYGWAATVVGWAWALVRGACDVLLGASVPLLAIGVIQSGIAMSLLGACGVPRPARPLRLWAIILLSLLLGVLGIAVFAGLFVLVYVQGTRTGIISNNIAFMTGCALAATLMKDRD